MEYLLSYKKIIVKVSPLNMPGGSGVIFHPESEDYSYVITAKHCIENEENCLYDVDQIEIKLKFNEKIINLKPFKIIASLNDDLAVILIEKPDFENKLIISDIRSVSDAIFIYGFPNILDDDEDNIFEGQRKKGRINAIRDDGKRFEIVVTDKIESETTTYSKATQGFSGSGIFSEIDGQIFLVGIYVESKDTDGSFQAMNAYEINQVNNLLENNNLSSLIPSSLLSFKKYIDSAFNGYYKEVESIFKSNAKKLLQIAPKDIAYGHKEKLYLPSESEWKKLLQNEEFWKGWLEVLTYNYLETGNIPVFKNDILQIYRNGKTHTQNIRLFFSDSENIHTVSSQFYHENIQDLSKNEIIIINSEKAMKGKIKVTEKDFEGRLEDISQPYKLQVYEESFDIYKTLYQKNTKFYHLNYFRQLISDIEIDPKIDINDTMITLKDSIKEFFEDV